MCLRRLSAAQMLMLQSLPCTAQRNLKGPLDQLMRPSVKVPPSARKGGWTVLLQAVRSPW